MNGKLNENLLYCRRCQWAIAGGYISGYCSRDIAGGVKGLNGPIADDAAEEMAYDLSYEYPINDSMSVTPFVYMVEESAANKDDAVGIGASLMFSF